MSRDFGFYSGERQIAPTFAEIRADHQRRYEWADARVSEGGFGLDAFCGNGYGSWLLSQKPRTILAVDASPSAIEFAIKHYSTGRVFFSAAHYPFELPKDAFDFVVCLESIEHVGDDHGFFQALSRSLKPGGDLIFSTPCEDKLPLCGTGNHFHFKHYSLEEALALPGSAELTLVEWAGQNCYHLTPERRHGGLLETIDMNLTEGVAGQFTIVHARKT